MATVADVREQLLRHLPKGWRNRLGPGMVAYYESIAEQLKLWCADLVDTLRLEVNPSTASQKLLEWEIALGLSQTITAKFGTVPRRRAAVISKLRERGTLSIPDLRAVMELFFNYADPAQIQVLETDRGALQSAHTYFGTGTPAAIPAAFPPTASFFTVIDDGPVSDAGAQLTVILTGHLDEIVISLTGPDGTTQQAFWPAGYLGTGAVAAQPFTLYAPVSKKFGPGPPYVTVAGNAGGRWVLTIFAPGGHAGTLHQASLFVEAVGRNFRGGEGLGGAMFELAVVADPALLNAPYDLNGAYQALQRIKPAWVKASIVQKNGVMGGGNLAIPDAPQTIPDACIPG